MNTTIYNIFIFNYLLCHLPSTNSIRKVKEFGPLRDGDGATNNGGFQLMSIQMKGLDLITRK